MIERPKFVTDEHLEYLDELRESGITNMWGAAEFVHSSFPVTKQEAKEILFYWMKTFGERND